MTMFKYDWSKIDIKSGLIFMVGVMVVFYGMGGTVLSQAVGTSALLAWCTVLLVPPQGRRRVNKPARSPDDHYRRRPSGPRVPGIVSGNR